MNAPRVVSDLRKHFGSLRVLEGVDLTLDAGRVTAVVGPNAAGKSTLIKCVLGLVRPSGGMIELLGQAVGNDPHYRRFIGYMPQFPSFPENLSVREIGLDRIGTFPRYRPSSSATSCAVEYLFAGTFSRHLRQIVSRSRGTPRFSLQGETTSS